MMTGMRGDRETGVYKPFRGVAMWSVGSKLVRPVDGVTVEENSEQMGDVDEVLGQMLFHVGHDGERSKVTGPGGISAK